MVRDATLEHGSLDGRRRSGGGDARWVRIPKRKGSAAERKLLGAGICRRTGFESKRGRGAFLLGQITQRDVAVAVAGLQLGSRGCLCESLGRRCGGARGTVEIGKSGTSRAKSRGVILILRDAVMLSHRWSRRWWTWFVEPGAQGLRFAVDAHVLGNKIRRTHGWGNGKISDPSLFTEAADRGA